MNSGKKDQFARKKAFPAQIAKKRPSATEAVLAELASTILDGSVPYEEALKRAQEQVEALDPAILAGGLEKALEEAMFKAAAEAMEESRPSPTSQPSQEELANSTDAQGNEHGEAGSGKGGQFVAKGEGGGAAAKDSPNKPAADKAGAPGDSGSSVAPAEAAIVTVGSTNTDSPEEKSRQIAKAVAAFEKCLSEQVDVPAAFHRSDIGDIDLRWGKTNKGLQHMVARRDAFAKAHPGAPDGKAIIAKMPETIIKGKVTEVTHSGGHPNIVIEHDGYRAIITRDREGGNHWFISGYDISDEGRGYRAKRK